MGSPLETTGLALSVGLGLALAFIAPFLVKRFGVRAFAVLALYPAAAFAFFVATPAGEWSYPWVRSLGIEFALRLDGLSRAFCLLITGLGALILLFASGYFEMKPNLARFAGAFVGFMAAMLGLVLSDDAIGLFVFWELTSITSFLLIGFYHKQAESRASAQQALLITGGGGLAMLAGLILLGVQQGTFRFSEMTPLAETTTIATPAFLLIVAGCVTKSAQFPFHFWLPNAMAAPTPVSAFLHSATMVKAGVFLLARIRPIFGELPLWTPVLSVFGAATVATAFLLLFWHRDLKKLLAYSTLSALGMLTFLLGQPGETALKAFAALLVAHALYKGGLFLVAGSIEHATGTRDVFALAGLRRAMPFTALAGALAAASGLGIVGFLGFQGKEYAILAAANPLAQVVTGLFALGTGLVVTRVVIIPFFVGSLSHEDAHEGPVAMWVGPTILGVLALAGGVATANVGPTFLTPLAESVQRASLEWSWKAFAGFNAAFFIGLVLIALGVGIGVGFRTTERGLVGLDAAWRRAIDALPSAAAVPSRWIQSGKLRNYFALFFALVTVCVLYPVWRHGGWRFDVVIDRPGVHEIAFVALAVVLAIAVVFSPSRLSAICMLGLVGTAVAVTFLAFGAPDLAMTQLLAELLTTVIAVLVFYRLPRFRKLSTGWTRFRDLFIAIAFGGAMALVVLWMQAIPANPHVAAYYAENSVEKAYGRNVVNTILVDFRAMDTLGEVTVLAVAALGVYALMRLRPAKEVDE